MAKRPKHFRVGSVHDIVNSTGGVRRMRFVGRLDIGGREFAVFGRAREENTVREEPATRKKVRRG